MTERACENKADHTSFRKLSHLEICLQDDVNARKSACWEDFHLVHCAIPNLNMEDICLDTEIFGKKLRLPIMSAAMTGGHPDVREVNENIARIAQEMNFGMGVGSQRAAIEKNVAYTTESFRIVRELAPDALLIGNLGAAQFSDTVGFGEKEILQSIDLIQADALAIHTNPAQELTQVEGDTFFRNFFSNLDRISKNIPQPIIIKEVGSGFAAEDAEQVQNSSIAGIDVGGMGGTSWVAVEALRAKKKLSEQQYRLGELFWSWGIPTPLSICETRSKCEKTLIATGGVRNGLQAAKAIALGADLVGMAMPFLHAAQGGLDSLRDFVRQFELELKTAMFLTNSKTIEDLRKVPMVVTGYSKEWLEQRNVDLKMPWRV